MISKYIKGPKNPFNVPLQKLQKSRQETSIEQYEEEIEGLNKEDLKTQILNQYICVSENIKQNKPYNVPPQSCQLLNQKIIFKSNNANQINDKFNPSSQSKEQQLNFKSSKEKRDAQTENSTLAHNTNNLQLKDQIYIKSQGVQLQIYKESEQIHENNSLKQDKISLTDDYNYQKFDSYNSEIQQSQYQSQQQCSNKQQKFSYFQANQLYQNRIDHQQENKTAQNQNQKKIINIQYNYQQKEESDSNNFNFDDSHEIEDENDQNSQSEINKFPNESIFSKNNEYFIKNHTSQKQNDNQSEDAFNNYQNKYFESSSVNEFNNQTIKHSFNNYNVIGSQYDKNGQSTNTFSPKGFQQMNQQGILFVNSSQNQSGQEVFNSVYQGLNSTFCSVQQASNLLPITRKHSTSSFQTILKKEKSTIERTDSNNTVLNPDSQIKKSGKVKFNQLSYVVNYEEDILEKTDFPYDDQMFQSDELEDDSLSLVQLTQNGNLTNKNKQTKITVLEKFSEKDRDLNMNSSLINSNINQKESDLSQSSNLLVIKSRSQNKGSGISALNNIQNSSSITQDNLIQRDQSNQNIQDIVQAKQDSVIFSQLNISPTNNQNKQFENSREDDFHLFPISNNSQIKFPVINEKNIILLNHKRERPSILNLKQHQNYEKKGSQLNNNYTITKINKHSNIINEHQQINYHNDNKTFKTIDKQQNGESTSNQNKQKVLDQENKKQHQENKEQQIENSIQNINTRMKQQQKNKTQMNERCESYLEMDRLESNLQQIMSKIKITPSKRNNQRKRKESNSSTCNIFSFICS